MNPFQTLLSLLPLLPLLPSALSSPPSPSLAHATLTTYDAHAQPEHAQPCVPPLSKPIQLNPQSSLHLTFTLDPPDLARSLAHPSSQAFIRFTSPLPSPSNPPSDPSGRVPGQGVDYQDLLRIRPDGRGKYVLRAQSLPDALVFGPGTYAIQIILASKEMENPLIQELGSVQFVPLPTKDAHPLAALYALQPDLGHTFAPLQPSLSQAIAFPAALVAILLPWTLYLSIKPTIQTTTWPSKPSPTPFLLSLGLTQLLLIHYWARGTLFGSLPPLLASLLLLAYTAREALGSGAL